MATSTKLTRKEQLAYLRLRRPSYHRSLILMWLLNAFGTVLGILFIAFTFVLAINAFFAKDLVRWVTDTPSVNASGEACSKPDTSRITWALAAFSFIIGILCFVIANLSRKVRRRTYHIAELEEVAEKDDETAEEGNKQKKDLRNSDVGNTV